MNFNFIKENHKPACVNRLHTAAINNALIGTYNLETHQQLSYSTQLVSTD